MAVGPSGCETISSTLVMPVLAFLRRGVEKPRIAVVGRIYLALTHRKMRAHESSIALMMAEACPGMNVELVKLSWTMRDVLKHGPSIQWSKRRL